MRGRDLIGIGGGCQNLGHKIVGEQRYRRDQLLKLVGRGCRLVWLAVPADPVVLEWRTFAPRYLCPFRTLPGETWPTSRRNSRSARVFSCSLLCLSVSSISICSPKPPSEVWNVNSKHLLAVRVSRSLLRSFPLWQIGTPNAYTSRQ